MSSINDLINFEYHIFPHRNIGECDGQYKERLRAYSIGMEVGMKHRQAEIDELVDTIKTSSESEMYLFDELQKVESEREHLQKRIDEISNHVEINYDENRDDDSCSYWSGYNQALRELYKILKGEETK